MPPGADAVAQARALLGQLRTLAAQHEQVLAAYERQLDVITAGGAAKLAQQQKSGALPNKRPLGPEPEGPEAKKQRMVAEQQQRRNALWHECYKVLDRCRRNQKAEAFKKPVDPIRMKIPDYPLIIKNPMDLQTVGEKLKARLYKDPADFAADMRLIWNNAIMYNGPTHPVSGSATAMSDFFEKAWSPLQIEKQWAIQLQQEELAREVWGHAAGGVCAFVGARGPVPGADRLCACVQHTTGCHLRPVTQHPPGSPPFAPRPRTNPRRFRAPWSGCPAWTCPSSSRTGARCWATTSRRSTTTGACPRARWGPATPAARWSLRRSAS